MHELWHVILAHTRLYPRPTGAHNIAFDAVINAGLAREFPGPEYRGFFEAVNPAETFPGLLLRPPEGWPQRPLYPDAGPLGRSRCWRGSTRRATSSRRPHASLPGGARSAEPGAPGAAGGVRARAVGGSAGDGAPAGFRALPAGRPRRRGRGAARSG